MNAETSRENYISPESAGKNLEKTIMSLPEDVLEKVRPVYIQLKEFSERGF